MAQMNLSTGKKIMDKENRLVVAKREGEGEGECWGRTCEGEELDERGPWGVERFLIFKMHAGQWNCSLGHSRPDPYKPVQPSSPWRTAVTQNVCIRLCSK